MRKNLLLLAITAGIPALLCLTKRPALAGETIRFRSQHVNVATRFDTIVVGDEPGHVIAMFEAKGLGIRREGPEEPPYKIRIRGTGDLPGGRDREGSGLRQVHLRRWLDLL